jgi:glycosyltransferase involved in cell wall biosynthesis
MTPRVLVFADYFLPGFRAGGPIQAIANTMAGLSADVSFAVMTRDHDTDGQRYPSIVSRQWNRIDGRKVYYAPRFTWRAIVRCASESAADALWLNSFFSRASLRVLLLRRLGRIRQPVLLAPRGEFSRGALSVKSARKRLAIAGLRTFRLLHDVHWVASSRPEADDIRAAMGPVAVTIVPESVGETTAPPDWPAKRTNALRMVFASRIDAMKNLRFLLEALAHTTARIHLDIIGPIDNAVYWAECRSVIGGLPANVTVTYLGVLPHQEIRRRLGRYDLLALPSLGENFGHIVVESWAAGSPVLVSDRTPWRNLAEAGVGWDLPLERDRWIDVLQQCAEMPAEAHVRMRRRAVERARRAYLDGIAGSDTLRRLIIAVVRPAAPSGAASTDGEARVDPTPCG